MGYLNFRRGYPAKDYSFTVDYLWIDQFYSYPYSKMELPRFLYVASWNIISAYGTDSLSRILVLQFCELYGFPFTLLCYSPDSDCIIGQKSFLWVQLFLNEYPLWLSLHTNLVALHMNIFAERYASDITKMHFRRNLSVETSYAEDLFGIKN